MDEWLQPAFYDNGITYPRPNLNHLNAVSISERYPKAVLSTLQWRLNERNGVWNYQRIDCLLNRLFRRKSKETSKFRATGLCEGNSPVTGEFPTQRTSSAENVSIWWRHHEIWVNHQQVDVMNVLANQIIAYANADQYFDTSLRNSGTLC